MNEAGPGDSILYLSRDAVASLDMTAGRTADAIEDLLERKAAGHARNAPKSALALADGRLFQAMVAQSEAPAFAAAKVVGLARDNAQRGLAHIFATLVLQDGATGAPVAVMDGARITEVRTAALTLVAARRLARDDAAVAGFIGCGAQARSHLSALADEFPLREVRAFSRSAGSAGHLAALARERGLGARVVRGPRDAVSGCDLVITSVPAAPRLEPFLSADWLDAGAFASLVDLGRSWRADTLARVDRIVVDDLEQEAHASARLVDESLAVAELTELVSGAAPGRTARDERIVFVFRGIGLADLAAAVLVYEQAREAGAGERLPR